MKLHIYTFSANNLPQPFFHTCIGLSSSSYRATALETFDEICIWIGCHVNEAVADDLHCKNWKYKGQLYARGKSETAELETIYVSLTYRCLHQQTCTYNSTGINRYTQYKYYLLSALMALVQYKNKKNESTSDSELCVIISSKHELGLA